jgi:LysM repeat protein
MNLSKILILAVLIWVVNSMQAQTPVVVNQSKVIQKIDGKDYYLHLVEKGQTLFSVAKAYNVAMDEIRQCNSLSGDKLITGQKIKIPKIDENVNQASSPEKSTIKQQGSGAGYFEYQARSKESLFQIALQYRVSIDEIYKLNPGIDNQLKNEQIIKIPRTSKSTNFITHIVKSKQSLNRLSKDYQIDINKIRAINPYIARNPEPGTVVKIPLSDVTVDEVYINDSVANTAVVHPEEPAEQLTGSEFCHNLMERGEYKVALLLPFYYSEIDSLRKIVEKAQGTTNMAGNPKSFQFIQFYEGFMMALDSIKEVGLRAKVYVFNVEDNVASAQQVILKPELKNMDIIIGPVHAKSFAVVAEFARENQIYIVNPFSSRGEIIQDNPFVFKVRPSAKSQFPGLVSYLNDKYKHAQIFIARNNETQDEAQIQEIKDEMKKNLAVREFPLTDLFSEIVYNRDSLTVFKRKASENRENVIVMYSENKAFLLDFMRKVNDLKDIFQITIIGFPSWKRIEGLDLSHLSNLNSRILAEDDVDYRSQAVKNLVRHYRETYKTEPQKYAFEGYDVGIYFMSALLKYGSHFGECISYFDMDLMSAGYDFEAEPGQGFENNYWKVLKMTENGLIEDSKKLPTYDFSKPPSKYYKYQE